MDKTCPVHVHGMQITYLTKNAGIRQCAIKFHSKAILSTNNYEHSK